MTSLIDVIFLLLLFFMLSSTFTRFGEIPFSTAGSGGGTSAERPVFLALAEGSLSLNGVEATLQNLPRSLAGHRTGDNPLTALVSARTEVTAQRLTDLLVVLNGIPDLRVTVLEGT